MRRPHLFTAIASALLLMAGTTAYAQNNTTQPIDAELSALISELNLTGNPAKGIQIPSIQSPKAQLGMKLFYSKTLGGDQTTACVSCHHPVLGGGDALSLPIGVGSVNPEVLGPNRVMKKDEMVSVPRNSPTTFNVALWKEHMFHDGRVKRLDKYSISTPDVKHDQSDPLAGANLVQAQARFPITSMEEMRGEYMKGSYNQTLRRTLTERLQGNWEKSFRVAFQDNDSPIRDVVNEQNVSVAIAEYERSQLFIKNPWSEYVAGNTQAISEQAKRGAALFFKTQANGGADCASCHSGDFFSDEQFYNTAMPQIGEGKIAETKEDLGCYSITGAEDDKYQFRTPSLLNVEVTGPWGHSGAYQTLEGVTAHMLNPKKAVRSYDAGQLKQKGIHLEHTRKHTADALMANIDIKTMPNQTKQDVKDLVSFMKTLTDPCVKSRECLSPWIPDQNSNDPDNNMLHGLRKAGQRL